VPGNNLMVDTGKILKITLFSELPREECEALLRISQPRLYECGSILFHEGDPSNSFLIILDGELEIIKNYDSDTEMRLGVLGNGEYLGEMSLFLRHQVRSASVRASRDTQVVEIPRADFEALLKRQPSLAFNLMQEMSLRMRNQDRLTTIDLRAKNEQLQKAYDDLKAAQAQIIAQEKLKHELEMARQIQESLLPKEIPQIYGWRLAAHWEPARAVSGDFYDFIPLPDGRLCIVVGDVTDKGVPAALVMATTHSILRAVANSAITIDGGSSPGWMLSQMNNVLQPDMPMYMFVTCIISILDPQTGALRFSTAGHPPPFHRKPQGVIELKAKGMPLGLLPDRVYEDHEVIVEKGDDLLFFSDGLIEAQDDARELFGEERLQKILAEYHDKNLIPFLLNEMAAFTHSKAEPDDDITLVTLDREK
jgi:phosphoserine phosphatase RsbU/P